MKVKIIYVAEHEGSIGQAQQSLNSWISHGWNAELQQGVTPMSLDYSMFPYPDLENGRLQSFKENEPRKYPIKVSCLFNNLLFAQKVLEENEPMVFAEHDSICIGKYDEDIIFEDFCYLAMEYAFKKPNVVHRLNYKLDTTKRGVWDFPKNYPLKYYKKTKYKGHFMSPGTIAYMLSPSGAAKYLDAAKENGLEQSDLSYNNNVLRLQYIMPSIVKFNPKNLNLSHKLKY